MNIKQLFIKLLRAQSEDDVLNIINKEPLLKDESNWKPYGGTFGNYSSFENQQSTAEGSLIEKVTNSIDAILTRQCYSKGIEPTGLNSPKTMKEALETLFTKEELANESVVVVTDGEKNAPNVIIMDDGEGQSPEDFERTFLSLQTGNKNNIKFVQGKFNMGSTGAVVFCGKHKFQLIASRKHQAISGKNDGLIGFTLVRKHIRTNAEKLKMKNTWYEYFTINSQIPSFFDESIKLVEGLEDPRYTFSEGSIVKLYNYNLEKKSQSFQQLKQDINSLLYYPAFPIYVMETRDFKRTNTANIAYGNGNLLRGGMKNSSIAGRLEFNSIKNQLEDPLFGRVEIDIYVFKEEEKETANEVRGTKPIVFLMNGQVQYHLGTTFITNKLGFKLIKNHLVVSIDCTNLSTSFLDEGLFMANRESIRQTPETKRFIELITSFLKENENLININKMRASKKITSKGTQEIFEKLLGKDKNTFLRKLFQPNSMGTNTHYNNHISKKFKKDEELDLLEYPSFFKFDQVKKDREGNYIKSIPINKKTQFKLKTDAANDYFTRSENPGFIKIEVLNKHDEGDDAEILQAPNQGDGQSTGGTSTATKKRAKVKTEAFSIARTDLNNGEMSISLYPDETNLQVGEEVDLQVTITDNNNSYSNLLTIRIESPVEKKKTNKKKQPEGLNLPPLTQVFKDQATIDSLNRLDSEKEAFETWESRDWTQEVGIDKIVEIVPGADEQNPISEIAINMSSPVLEQIINEEGTTGNNIELAQEQFLMTLYMQSFLITSAINQMTKDQQELKIDEIEDFCSNLIKKIAYASVKMQLNALRSVE